MISQFETMRTTVTIPTRLIQRSQRFLDLGIVPNRNAFVVAAMERFVEQLEREEIDRQFAEMAEDVEYQALDEEVVESFRFTDWEALNLAEQSA